MHSWHTPPGSILEPTIKNNPTSNLDALIMTSCQVNMDTKILIIAVCNNLWPSRCLIPCCSVFPSVVCTETINSEIVGIILDGRVHWMGCRFNRHSVTVDLGRQQRDQLFRITSDRMTWITNVLAGTDASCDRISAFDHTDLQFQEWQNCRIIKNRVALVWIKEVRQQD